MKRSFFLVTVENLTGPTHGGVTRTKFLSIELSKIGKVTVFAPSFGEPLKMEGEDSELKDIRFVTKVARKPHKFLGRFSLKPRLGVAHFDAIENELYKSIADSAPDYVVWSHSYLAAAGMQKIREQYPEVQHIVDFPNIEQNRLRAFVKHKNIFVSIVRLLELLKSIRWEKMVARSSNMNIAVSQVDAQFLELEYGAKSLLAPNGLEIREYVPQNTGKPIALAVGDWYYEPNLEGLKYFLTALWPKICSTFPEIELRIAGKCPQPLAALIDSSPAAKRLGYVENLSNEYKKALFCLAPARFGAGTQLKVLEALSHSRPVIGDFYLTTQIEDLQLQDCVFPTEDYLAEIEYVIDNAQNLSRTSHSTSLGYSWDWVFENLKTWVGKH